MKLFVQGRQTTFTSLEQAIKATDKTIWMHCASLGEYEQGVPVLEEIKNQYPNHKIVVTFFSPSGYEVKKNTNLAHTVLYLPMDTARNAKRFINKLHPDLAIFVKYEVWPNYLRALKKQEIHTILISGLFRENQHFFSSFGNFMRRALRSFDYTFVQNENSKTLLSKINQPNVVVAGDTRFDRVSRQIEMDNNLDFLNTFKGDALCIVCGSTWPQDEQVLLPYINKAPNDIKFIIAPHKIDVTAIKNLRDNLTKKSVRYSQMDDESLKTAAILIVDTVGLLTKIYSYGDLAYVGGAMGTTGLHNVLEPATFGLPIVIGSNFKKFPEAARLQSLAGLFSVSNAEECSKILEKLVSDKNFRSKTGLICEHWINSNTGATRKIMAHINTVLKLE